MQSIPQIHQDPGAKNQDRLPLLSQVRLFFRRNFSLENRRKIKRHLFLDRKWQSGDIKHNGIASHNMGIGIPLNLVAGDMVRIRTKEEIQATLNREGKLKGCSFIGEMWQYCGTTQKVFKPVTRFVDERNYKVVHAKGLVLLEGVMCSGTDFYGKCDRSCLFFWREEWLEKI
jgi:hypothetical protein